MTVFYCGEDTGKCRRPLLNYLLIAIVSTNISVFFQYRGKKRKKKKGSIDYMMTQHNWEFYLATLFKNLLSNGFSTLKMRVINYKAIVFL